MQNSFSKKQLTCSTQSGAALFVALIMLLVLTIIGISASQRSSLQERMASNMHLDSMTFNASESAIASFLNEANQGNPKANTEHVLSKILSNQAIDKQYDESGLRVASGFLDKNLSGGSLIASVEPSIIQECQAPCPGFSLSTRPEMSCRVFLFEGQGQLSKGGATVKTTNTSLFVRQITPCL